MATISEALAIAIGHHQAGRLRAAEQIYRQILQADPNQADAVHFLGVIASQVGQHRAAVEYLRRAIGLNDKAPAFHNNLGEVYRALGRTPESLACYRRALELNPDYATAHNNLGIALKDLGKPEEAVACFHRALELEPNLAATHNNLGAALQDQRKTDQAIACFRRALELKPDHAEALYNLGVAFKDQGNPDQAIACYRRALELKPDFAMAHNNLGNALKDQGKLDQALACYHRALELKPDFAEAHNNLGNSFNGQAKLDEAVACYRRALELKPDYAEARNNLGATLRDQGKFDEAIACYRQTLALKPDYAMAHSNLGNALKDQGKTDEAIACYRRALELNPDYAAAYDNLLLALQYCTTTTPAILAEAHAEFDRRFAAPLAGALAPQQKVRDRQGRLRLGFVSADLGQHPVGYFLLRALENLSREEHEIFCYSDRTVNDGLAPRFHAAASQWRDVAGVSDQRLAEQIRADQIDILFDLAGHTARNRLLVFARKPAPVQITWIGYEGTTGLSAMDYLIADRYVVPPETERWYQEKVLRMPDGYLCYDPPAAAPPVGPPPLQAKGWATFGSFSNLAKITPQVVEVWAEILRHAPQVRLALKYRGLGDPMVQQRYLDLFAAQGIPPQRLELSPPNSYADYLAAYQQVDVALDPFPFSGSVTTCEALWMGVPVITCPGATFASRHSLSHLSNVGLTETIARDFEEYVKIALSLAADLPRLAELRAGLRQRMAASPLCDGKRFANHLASLLRDVCKPSQG